MLENKPLTSNVGKWDACYRNLSVATPRPYADAVTYLMAAAFLADVDEVEDWGCGGGGFRTFCISPQYVGLDGSKTPFADKIVDLCTYRSTAAGIMMRHVLEHNYEWEKVLDAALQSFQKKFCLILFTPFVAETKEIAYNGRMSHPSQTDVTARDWSPPIAPPRAQLRVEEGARPSAVAIDVPDLSFRREDIERHFDGVNWKLIQNIPTRSHYGVEHVYFIWRT